MTTESFKGKFNHEENPWPKKAWGENSYKKHKKKLEKLWAKKHVSVSIDEFIKQHTGPLSKLELRTLLRDKWIESKHGHEVNRVLGSHLASTSKISRRELGIMKRKKKDNRYVDPLDRNCFKLYNPDDIPEWEARTGLKYGQKWTKVIRRNRV